MYIISDLPNYSRQWITHLWCELCPAFVLLLFFFDVRNVLNTKMFIRVFRFTRVFVDYDNSSGEHYVFGFNRSYISVAAYTDFLYFFSAVYLKRYGRTQAPSGPNATEVSAIARFDLWNSIARRLLPRLDTARCRTSFFFLLCLPVGIRRWHQYNRIIFNMIIM